MIIQGKEMWDGYNPVRHGKCSLQSVIFPPILIIDISTTWRPFFCRHPRRTHMSDAPITDKPYFPAGGACGLKFLRPMSKLLERLRPEAAHRNRELFFDHYLSMLLLYFFSPTMSSLRDIQRASDCKTVARKLGVRRADGRLRPSRPRRKQARRGHDAEGAGGIKITGSARNELKSFVLIPEFIKRTDN